MFLKLFYPSGTVKYSGWTKKPRIKRGQKLYDIEGIMLWLFESKFIVCYDEKGHKIDQGIVKGCKITKTVKDNESDCLLSEFDEDSFISLSDFSDDFTIESDDTCSDFYSYQGETFKNIPNGKGILRKNGKIEYIGHFLDGKKHGKGITFINDKKFHFGNYVENEFHGEGKYYHPNLQTIVFEGKFKKGSPFIGKFFCNGKIIHTGLFKNFCGDFCHLYENKTYIGHFRNGKRDGYGELTYLSYGTENIYRGHWKNDEYDGKGLLLNNGNVRYDGEWKNGMKDGFGKHYIYFCGGYVEKYVGNFVEDKKEGYGIEYEGCTDDDTNKVIYQKEYSGWWENHERNGDGLCFYNGILHYDGELKNDAENGFGRRFYEDGTLQYEGYFKANEYDGIGKLFYIDGTISFDGIWKYGNPYCGTFYNFEDGSVHRTKIIDGDYYTKAVLIEAEGNGTIYYRGDFKNGLCHGEGISESYRGAYKNGKYHGYGTFHCSNENKSYTGQFINGYFWDGKSLKLLEYNQIVYEGTIKDEKYDTGIETILNEEDYYEFEIIGYRKWKNGEIVNEKKERRKIRQNMLISSFLETRNKKFLKKVDRKTFLEFLKENYNMKDVEKKTKKQLAGIIEKKKLELKEVDNEEKIDLFGNEIINPVRGTDEGIYDESSMLYLFQKDENDDFINISYIYNDNGERIPKYPIMTNGKILNGYVKF